MTQAFVYRWTHIPTSKWYIGSRTGKNCHPNDGYICSSKIVKPLIQANPKEWRRDILKIGTKEEMLKHEASLLHFFNAKKDPLSFNQTNGHKDFGGRGKGIKNKNFIDFNNMTAQQITNGYLKAINSNNLEKVFQYDRFILSKVLTHLLLK